MPKLSYNQRRIILAASLILFLVSEVSRYWKLHWFGDFDGPAEIVGIAFLFVAVLYIGPTVSELKQRRVQRDGELRLDE